MSDNDSSTNQKSYHPQSKVFGRSGYYGNLNETQQLALKELKAKVESDLSTSTYPYDDEDIDLKLLRFLRARKFNVSQAYELLCDDVKWRIENKRYLMKYETSDELLAPHTPMDLYKYFPSWIQGHDKEGRPVSYRDFGRIETTTVLNMIGMEKLIRYHAWEAEMAIQAMKHTAKSSPDGTPYIVDTFVLVVDAELWSISYATSDALAFIRNMANTDSNHYPERLGTLVLVNAPFALSFTWNIIKTFLDDVTKQKIKIYSNKKDWLPVLLELIDEDQIPLKYGGTAPDLTPEQHIASLNQFVLPKPKELNSNTVTDTNTNTKSESVETNTTTTITTTVNNDNNNNKEGVSKDLDIKGMNTASTSTASFSTDDETVSTKLESMTISTTSN